MSKGYVDKRLGMYRDAGGFATTPGSDLEEYINNTINQFITVYDQDLRKYITNLVNTIEVEIIEMGDEITQETINYYQSIITQLTEITEQIENIEIINQEFKTEITNILQTFEEYITNNIIEGDTYTEIINNYIDARTTEITEILQEFITNYYTENLTEYITNIINNYYEDGKYTRLISGNVIWLQNLEFAVSNLVYEILGQHIESQAVNITLPTNTEANPRYAVIYADVFGQVGYILGDAAADPLKPIVDPSTQLEVTVIYIAALGEVPAADPEGDEIVNEIIYDENIEWTTAKTDDTAITTDFDALTEPATGLKHINIATFGETVTAERGELLISAVSKKLPLQLVLTEPLSVEKSLTVLPPDNKTDYTEDGIRHLIYYSHSPSAVLTLKNTVTNTKYTLLVASAGGTVWSIAELNFSVKIPTAYTFQAPTVPIPAGTYKLEFSPVTRYEQLFTVGTGSALATPAAAALSFTRAAGAIDASTANILLSLKTSTEWLTNTGFVFQLFNGADKVGELAFIGEQYGFNPANNLAYQQITIPIADFNPTNTEFDKLVMVPVNTWPATANIYIDNIILQTGVILPEDPTEPTAETIEFLREVPAGTIDGVNKTFTITKIPMLNSETLVLNSFTQHPEDYTLTDNVIVYTIAPEAGETHIMNFAIKN